MTFEVYYFIVFISFVSILLTRKDHKPYYMFMMLLLATVLIVEGSIFSGNNNAIEILHYFYSPIEFTLLGLAYGAVLNNSLVKKSIGWMIIVFWLITVVGSIFVNEQVVDSILSLCSHAGILTLSLHYFYKTFQPPFVKGKLSRSTFFWINSANLFYYSGALLQITLGDFLTDLTINQQWIMYYINTTFNHALYLIYLIGFTCQRIFK